MEHNSIDVGEMQDNRGKTEGSRATQFQAGESGNPEGKLPGTRNYSTIYKAALKKLADKNNTTPEEIEDELVANGILSARKGNYNFYKDVQDRLHGQAMKRIAGDIDITNRERVDDPVVAELTREINELYKRTGGRGDGGTPSPLGTEA